MKRPTSHPSLPFDAPAEDGDMPLEVTVHQSQPSLLSARATLETDVVQAIESGRWREALDTLGRLRAVAVPTQVVALDAATPVIEALASRTALDDEEMPAWLARVTDAAATNPWLRHVATSLAALAISRMGTPALASRLEPEALVQVYRLTRGSARPELGVSAARRLLRDALVCGVPVPVTALDDRDLEGLEASDLSPAWYPVVGAIARLWPVPKETPSAAGISAMLSAAEPDDDEGRARLFWQCYRAWKAQREPNDVVSRTRARMKQLHPDLFARLG